MASLDSIADISDQKQKIEQYKETLRKVISARDVGEANALVDHSK